MENEDANILKKSFEENKKPIEFLDDVWFEIKGYMGIHNNYLDTLSNYNSINFKKLVNFNNFKKSDRFRPRMVKNQVIDKLFEYDKGKDDNLWNSIERYEKKYFETRKDPIEVKKMCCFMIFKIMEYNPKLLNGLCNNNNVCQCHLCFGL